MTVINTNFSALRAQLALGAVARGSAQAMEEMATGKRINAAADDAAGLAIVNKMGAQIRGLSQALRNIGDAGSMLQTAEGASEEIAKMLQRMRELSVQSLNDTLAPQDRQSLDLEFQQLKQQIDQIANQTEWNGGVSLLNTRQQALGEAVPAERSGLGEIDTSALPSGSYDLFINGVQVSIAFVQNELPDARLGKIVNAIQSSRSQHGAVADLNGDGSIALRTPDGRDLAVWYDSGIANLSAASFGLGRNGAIAQIEELAITDPTAGAPQESRTNTYVEYTSPDGQNLSLPTRGQPDQSLGAISVVGGTVYRGLGGSAQAFGVIDSVKNGQSGQALRINYLSPFVNGTFESGSPGSTTAAGWSLYPQRVLLDGIDQIAGYPTPVDNRPESGSYVDISNSYTAQLSDASVAPGGSSLSMMLKSTALVIDSYGVSHGPYIVSDPLYVPAAESVSFQWRATGDTDTFDIYAYLLNVDTGGITPLLNRTGTSLADATSWTTTSAQVPATGNYRFVFVSGSYDFSGGRATGATMFVDNVQVSGNPPSQKPTSTELDALFGMVESQPASGALQASFELRGQTISSGPSASSAQALRQLKDRIDTLNQQGQLRGVSAQLIGGKLRLTSLYPGEAMGVNQLSVNNNRYVASAQTVQAAQAGDEHATGLAGANAGSTGAQVARGVQLSAQSVASAGQLRYQVGANAGEIIEFEFQDFTGEEGMLDALTWDLSQRRLARANLVGSALGQTPVNDEGQGRSHISNSQAAAQALSLLDMMLQRTDTRRSLLGAAMNRLLAAGNNVSVGVVQQSGSRSQIEDTDYAKTASTLAKQQIVQNAASAVLAQANIRPKEILKLLGV